MNRTFTLTTEQLLTHWRRHRLYEPVAPGGAELSLTLSPGTEACMAVVAPEPDSGFTLTPALLARICSYDL